jgi:hypothetical protein
MEAIRPPTCQFKARSASLRPALVVPRSTRLSLSFLAPARPGRRPKPPGQIKPPPTHTGVEHRRRPPCGTDTNRVAAARTTGCYRESVTGTTKHTGCSRTHTHTSTGAFGGRHWVANWELRSVARAGRWAQRRRRRSTGGYRLSAYASIPCCPCAGVALAVSKALKYGGGGRKN